MNYYPYNLTFAQQFPWYGTIRLRGIAAERDAQVALAELVAARLATVSAVRRAYYDPYAGLKTAEILRENGKILEDFHTIAKGRFKTGGTQADVIRSEVLLTAASPELQGRLTAIARDDTTIGLAKKRSKPNITLGLTDADIEKTNAVTRRSASGLANIGFVIAFNLPIHKHKYIAGVAEAHAQNR